MSNAKSGIMWHDCLYFFFNIMYNQFKQGVRLNLCGFALIFVEVFLMKFSEKINEYISVLSCTAKDLCSASGISEATLSRYRNSERVPELGTDAFEKLCTAVARTARKKGFSEIDFESVKAEFCSCDDFVTTDKENLRQNFNALISALNINLNRLCKYINYDVSTIFRIRNGTRRPADPEQFASAIASFVSREIKAPAELAALSELLGFNVGEVDNISERSHLIKNWLLETQSVKSKPDSVTEFLSKLDEFDLNEYIKVIKFDKLKVPSVPFQLPLSKTYFGLEEMMESELDFLKATVLSKSTEPVTMYSDMPLKEMAKDPEFPKKWMFGMALMLKKGLHLNQIHNIDRSFDEMMLGLESWIPMYMTGQISPYYLKNVQNNVFLHFLKVSGAAALSGEAIARCHSDGKYYLTKSKKEIEYYKRRADDLLKNAFPLMDIYRSKKESDLNSFLLADSEKDGRRRSILSTLPLYTISEELLIKILSRHGISDAQLQNICGYAEAQCKRVENILKYNPIEDEIPLISDCEFSENPPSLELSGIFCEKDIFYNRDEYFSHLESSKKFAAEHPNYSFKETSAHTFRNLQIIMHEKQWAMISKSKAPAIHFVIRHPKLRNAIENFIPPVVDKE